MTVVDETWIDTYDLVWDSPSLSSAEGMPCGGAGIGLLVWVENGDLLFYIDRSGSFDENNQLLKLGRVRIKLSPNLLLDPARFEQRLRLREGRVEIVSTVDGAEARVSVWVEIDRPVIHVEVDSDVQTTLTATYETWRSSDRPLALEERMAAFSFYRTDPAHVPVLTRADEITGRDAAVRWYHRNDNEDLLFDKVVTIEHLDSVRDQLWNPQRDMIFGGELSGPGLRRSDRTTDSYRRVPFTGWSLESESPQMHHRVDVVLHSGAYPDLADWHRELEAIAPAEELDRRRDLTADWWAAFWNRSHVQVNPTSPDPADPAWQVGRNYQLSRHLLGCNIGGQAPSKFNGGLFTWDPDLDAGENELVRTPDFRYWGGASVTPQNQRLLHYPMLPAGDGDLLLVQLDFYLRCLRNAELRTGVYWGHRGASFTEQMENFGLPCLHIYDSDPTLHQMMPRPGEDPGQLDNLFCCEQYDTVLEFCLMALQLQEYQGADITRYLPLIDSVLTFFDKHYRRENLRRTGRELSEDGTLVLFPSSACETYKDALNPTPVVCGLRVVTERLLALPQQYGSSADRDRWARIAASVPAVGRRTQDGVDTIAPAWSWSRIQNEELPQLYSVFPWGLHGIGRDDLELARNTFRHGADTDEQRGWVGWKQDPIWAARLGLVDDARALVTAKLSDAPRRYPAFWGPGFDWTPDLNHGGSGSTALQEMILQPVGDTLHICPAWPDDWDVSFRLCAPRQTTVSGTVRAGRLVSLEVEPAERAADVVLHLPSGEADSVKPG